MGHRTIDPSQHAVDSAWVANDALAAIATIVLMNFMLLLI
jgi:hypothetical protein